MPNSLLTGVSGLLAHQRLLDLVGNNIANVNTIGFKSQRAIFADLLNETIRPASSGNIGSAGGSNPTQIGGGVKLQATDRKFSQGSLESTGEQFDVAISGDGFFVVTDGVTDFYTRAGMFSPDDNGILTAPGGLKVKRFPGVGEADGINPAFQIPGTSDTRIPIGSTIAGVRTTNLTLTGNLSANLTPDLQEVMSSRRAFQEGGNPATGATLLNNLDDNKGLYGATPEEIHFSGTETNGDQLSFSLMATNATTLQDVVNAINANVTGFTAAIVASGNIELTAVDKGPSVFKLQIQDAPGGTGTTDFLSHAFGVTTEGKWADTYPQTVTVYDEQGGAHEVTLEFEKVDTHEWTMRASLNPSEGVFTDGVVTNIKFNDDGSLQGTGDTTLQMQINGLSLPQELSLSFLNPDTLEGLTHYRAKSSLIPTQNGSAPGVITSITIEADGKVSGIASNGRTFTVAQLAIAGFRNAKGLTALRDNLFQVSLSSGEPELGLASSGSRGELRGGQLETSNVDIAFEFTRLIVAQRGFAANARTITVSDEMLEELTNIIR
jgi:flagellar hook protein FlgE